MDRTDLFLGLILLCLGIYGAIVVFAVVAMVDLLRDIRREIKSHQTGRPF